MQNQNQSENLVNKRKKEREQEDRYFDEMKYKSPPKISMEEYSKQIQEGRLK